MLELELALASEGGGISTAQSTKSKSGIAHFPRTRSPPNIPAGLRRRIIISTKCRSARARGVFICDPRPAPGTFGTERIFELNYDKTPPTTSAAITSGTLGENDWYTTDVEVTITPADAGAGVAATVYCLDQVDECTPTSEYSAPDHDRDGGHELSPLFLDGLGGQYSNDAKFDSENRQNRADGFDARIFRRRDRDESAKYFLHRDGHDLDRHRTRIIFQIGDARGRHLFELGRKLDKSRRANFALFAFTHDGKVL